jgi:DNA-binding response OmpR family regulator
MAESSLLILVDSACISANCPGAPEGSTKMAKLLVVEDDELLAESLVDYLRDKGHEVEWVDAGGEALSRLKTYFYDVAIVDWQLPEMTGPEILREYRNYGGRTPIMMLTSFDSKEHKLTGFDVGADDYVTKPFDADEVAARIQALLRRPIQLAPDALTLGNLEINLATRLVYRNGEAIRLLPKEFALLEFLLRRPDQCFDVDALLNNVWSSESEATESAVWQTVKRLRQKLDQPGKDSVIVNVKGMGYKIEKQRIARD